MKTYLISGSFDSMFTVTKSTSFLWAQTIGGGILVTSKNNMHFIEVKKLFYQAQKLIYTF